MRPEASPRERFAQAVRERGGSVAVAPLLGCSRAYVDMIVRSTRSPGMRVAYAIEQLCGITMQSWVTHRGAR